MSMVSSNTCYLHCPVPKTGNSLEDRRIMMGFDVSTARASVRESTVYLKFSVLENEGWL